MHPHIFVTAEKYDGLRSLEEVRRGIRRGHLATLWDQLLALADADAVSEPFTPTTPLSIRNPLDIGHANREYTLVNAVAQRIQRAGLAYLISERTTYRDDALRQMEVLFDTRQWPDWRDKAHPRTEVDLRGGMLTSAIALTYDWMHPFLEEARRRWILDGLDERGLKPYFRDIGAGAYWADVRTNWLTTIVGGLGIAGMALAEDHPRSQELVDFAMPRMTDYLGRYGPDGEFNESVGYSSSTVQPVAFFAALRYASLGGENRLAEHPFPQTCRWTLYFTLPPGRYAAFGDGHVDAPPALTFLPAVADATRDGTLQKFYLDYAGQDASRRVLPWELLWYDPSLKPVSLEGRVPTARAFRAHGACFSSRTGWDPDSTASVVYGKGGSGAIVHGHHDVGQICIDGYGERLIVDLGSPPGYPGDYGANKYEYYNASSHGHNVMAFGGREMRHAPKERAEILEASFEDGKGSIWQIDLTPKYDGVKFVRRTVVHLHPEAVVVLDEAELEIEEDFSLRWHTVVSPTLDPVGCFIVRGNRTTLSARVVDLNGSTLGLGVGRHAYHAPYNRHRLGDLFEQRHEPYAEITGRSRGCRIVSLFAVCPPGEPTPRWEATGAGWRFQPGDVTVSASDTTIACHSPHLERNIHLLKHAAG